MKFLRKKLDELHTHVKPGGKYEKFYAIYEMADTFLYTPDLVTRGQTHVRDGLDLKRMMIMVVVALGPCILMAMYNTGYQTNVAIQALVESGEISQATAGGWRGAIMDPIGYSPGNFVSCFLLGALYFLPIFIVTQIAGGACEVVFASIRKHEINEGFLVTGMLYPLTLPPTIPLWQVAIGIIFGVVVGKEIFGGTGKNFLNPALTARAFLYFAYPAQMSGDKVWVATPVDGYSAATSLGALADPEQHAGMAVITEQLGISWSQAFFGFIPGSMGETSTLACLLGAIILVATGIGSWRIMVSVLVGALGSAWLFNLGVTAETPNMFLMPPHWHLVVGGLAFGLVFMATDPVSATMTEKGKWIYGLVIGVTTTLVRVINPGYPEGIMLAILFGNVVAPLIDYCVIQLNIRRRRVRCGL
ncbi:Na(+)-translocating NADH-quinone reductase subunit B [Thalassoglobus neptunius]|uniref:Na(+)-translocating NADH-quinone reductase subunit B n=1 Tax=Thalassoglobus neptunius TaxID=1938619 RepID=A0A5C5X8J8_9PLAN|nr:NADH:ubiquinone reductase (Na(+)-transporting) subunit B [Thalassoglobus neptunius]TWT58681.1 Na(+)-translocating NADH-quinone reductase subunit B [Thalassoglobus neptunius]